MRTRLDESERRGSVLWQRYLFQQLCGHFLLVFLQLVLLISTTSPVCAENQEVVQSGPGAQQSSSEELQKSVRPEEAEIEDLDRYAEGAFDSAMSLLTANDYGSFVDKLSEMTSKLKQYGFTSFPSFSEDLMRFAEMVIREGDEANGLFLVRKAVELSPHRSEAYFSAARMYFPSDKRQSIEYATTALQRLPDSPRVLLGAGMTALLVSLVSLTITLLLVTIGEVAFGLREIYLKIGQMFRVQTRGLGSVLVMAALLILPVIPGLLSALVIWAVISTLTFRHCRYLFLTAAATVAAWGLSIPVMQAVIATMHISDDTAVEEVADGAYRPGSLKILSTKTFSASSSEEIDFSYAFQLQKMGQREEAELAYNRMLKGKVSTSIESMVKNNLAEIYLRQGEPARAKTYLEEGQVLGLPQIYIDYNMSRVSLALLDTVAHQQFYQAAKSKNTKMVEEFDRTFDRGSLAIVGLNKVDILRYLFHAHQIAGPEVFKERKKREHLLSESLINGCDSFLIMILGLLLTVCGMLVVFTQRARDSEEVSSAHSTSRLWLLIPGGYLLVAKKPVSAALVAAMFIAFIILSLDAPLVSFSVLPAHGAMDQTFMVFAFMFYVGNLIASLVSRRRRFSK